MDDKIWLRDCNVTLKTSGISKTVYQLTGEEQAYSMKEYINLGHHSNIGMGVGGEEGGSNNQRKEAEKHE